MPAHLTPQQEPRHEVPSSPSYRHTSVATLNLRELDAAAPYTGEIKYRTLGHFIF